MHWFLPIPPPLPTLMQLARSSTDSETAREIRISKFEILPFACPFLRRLSSLFNEAPATKHVTEGPEEE
jgi:hypothetical protein